MTVKKTIAATVVVTGVSVWLIARTLTRRLTEGDSESDEFSLAAIIGGVERASTATALRRGRVVAACGGVDLDLRAATLDPAGAELVVEAYCGGVQVRVPADWRVEVKDEVKAGGVETKVTPPDELPEDAPALRVEAIARMGGVLVAAESRG